MLNEKTVGRFWSKVARGADDECWEWQASRSVKGYGNLGIDGKSYLAHRVAFEVATGRAPTQCVCHRCDNRACCNPAHLFEASQEENITDMDRKHRRATGEALRRNKLSERDIPIIRALVKWSGFLNREVAVEYGVAVNTISEITAGRAWAHV